MKKRILLVSPSELCVGGILYFAFADLNVYKLPFCLTVTFLTVNLILLSNGHAF